MYQCQDCTYKGKQFIAGACPGCGSKNIRKIVKQRPDEDKPAARRSYRMILAWALWAYLFYVSMGMAGIV